MGFDPGSDEYQGPERGLYVRTSFLCAALLCYGCAEIKTSNGTSFGRISFLESSSWLDARGCFRASMRKQMDRLRSCPKKIFRGSVLDVHWPVEA